MTVLTPERRQQCCQELMAELSTVREPLAILEADLQAAVNACDDWQNSNAAAFKAAIPQPARGAMTNSQLSRMFNKVSTYRYGDGS